MSLNWCCRITVDPDVYQKKIATVIVLSGKLSGQTAHTPLAASGLVFLGSSPPTSGGQHLTSFVLRYNIYFSYKNFLKVYNQSIPLVYKQCSYNTPQVSETLQCLFIQKILDRGCCGTPSLYLSFVAV